MRFLLLFSTLLLSFLAQSQVDTLPLMDICNMQYEGAFRVDAGEFGESSLNYSNGAMAYNPANNSLFIVGHPYQQAIAEFAIPTLSTATTLAELPMVDTPLQDFYSVIPSDSQSNPDGLDDIGGMMFIDGPMGPELLINCYEYYDAAGTNTQTSIVIENPDDLANMTTRGFYEMASAPGHVCRWFSPVPPSLQDTFGGTDIAGSGVGLPIISRLTVGPSAFVFDPLEYINADPATDVIATTELLDYSLTNPMHDSTFFNYPNTGDWLYNGNFDNKLMTYVTNMEYGFIVPGTRTYFVIGRSGGHEYGVCYKCTQDDGNLCGGYCTPVADDNDHYYWSFDIADLLAVKNGDTLAHEIEPYAFGKIDLAFDDNGAAELGGAAYDEASGILYLCLNFGDLEQGTYARPPLIIAYSFDIPVAPSAICQDVTLSLNNQSALDVLPSDIDNGSIMNCENDAMIISDHTFTCEDVGTTYNLELLIQDINGNSSSCTSQVTVIDTNSTNIRVVTSKNDTGPGSLRNIVADACENDIITFDISLVNDTIFLQDSRIDLNDKNLTIQGLGMDQFFISGNFENLVFKLEDGHQATIKDLNIINGYMPSNSDAGGIDNKGILTLEHVKFSNNTNDSGAAAISNQPNGQIIINGSIIVEN